MASPVDDNDDDETIGLTASLLSPGPEKTDENEVSRGGADADDDDDDDNNDEAPPSLASSSSPKGLFKSASQRGSFSATSCTLPSLPLVPRSPPRSPAAAVAAGFTPSTTVCGRVGGEENRSPNKWKEEEEEEAGGGGSEAT